MDAAPVWREYLWPDPSGPYRLRLWFGDVGGRPVVVGAEMWGVEPVRHAWGDGTKRATARDLGDDVAGFEVVPRIELPDTPITAASIRLPLGKLLDAWVEQNRSLARAALTIGAEAGAVAAFMRRFEAPTKAGRPPLTTELLDIVAEQYRKAEQAGSRAPARTVTNYMQRIDPRGRSLKHATVRSWIKTARKRGLLSPAKPREPRQFAAQRARKEAEHDD